MLKKQIHKKALVLFVVISFFLSFSSISQYKLQLLNYNVNEEQIMPEIAQSPLSYSAITQNATTVYRLFESINFTINTFGFEANYTKMEISFTNGTIREFDMQFIGGNLFSGIYDPGYDAPLGMHNVSFLIFNETNQLLNTQTTYTNFTINTNYLLNLYNSENYISSEYFINDTIYAEIMVSNFKSYNFTWNTTIVDSINEFTQENIISFQRDCIQFNLLLENETFDRNQFYYVQLNITDKNSSRKEIAYFPLYVRNNNPIFMSPLILSSDEVFREEDFTLSFNVTDIETKSEDLNVIVNIYDSEGRRALNEVVEFDSNNLFSGTYHIAPGRPIGIYRINVTAIDKDYGVRSKRKTLIVKNNAPEIHSYTINGLSMDQPISIFYGRDLDFSFNVSDVEGIAYVKVALINENLEWYNITRTYTGENTEITFRTIDLIGGVWYVYIYVIDTDGTVVSLTDDYGKAPQGIRIIPDAVGYYLPWILFFGALIFGLILGVLASYSYFKSKVEPQKITPKKKDIPVKKTGPKKRAKSIPRKEEPETKELDENKPEKEEEKEQVPQRKIKRKL